MFISVVIYFLSALMRVNYNEKEIFLKFCMHFFKINDVFIMNRLLLMNLKLYIPT